MKAFHLAAALAAATTLLAGTSAFAEDKPAEGDKKVAFRTTIGSPRYVTTGAKGALNTSGKEVTGRSIFVLVDANGGELADGDKVQIQWAPTGARPTYWYETETGVGRIGGKPKESSTFTLKLKSNVKTGPKFITLQTASGKWVSAPEGATALGITAKQEDALGLELVENPTPKPAE